MVIRVLIVCLICSGSPGQTVTSSARSGDSSEVSNFPCVWDSGVNFDVNGSFADSQAFVSSVVMFLSLRTSNPKVAGSSPAGRVS